MMLKVGFIYPLSFFVWLQSTLPMSWRIAITHLYFRLRGLRQVSQCCKDALLQFCEPTVFYNVRTLVWDELRVIQKLDTEILTRYSNKMKVYFAMEDQWAPLTHCETLKTAIPQLSVEVLDSKFKHAFTLDTAQDMAEKLVVDLVDDDILKQDSCL
uniref:Lipid droplet-associated serine hydrolase n=2 Tax=Homalodisca liturata TaxID=320908 RepID=A0A1B6HZU2_9HEMI